VTPHIELSKLTETEKDALILALLPLVSQLEAAQKRIAALEAQVEALTRPPKTPDNSSKPPSQGQKSNRPQPGDDTPPRKPRPGVGRALHPNPDRVVDATLAACPHCRRAFPAEWQTPQQVYDRIELPPIKPDVYLHYAHAIGLERLAALMGEMFALSISEGAISNMLARARDPLLAAAAAIRETVMTSKVVCSDETSARVTGKTWWEWVFVGTLAVLHIIRPSRGKAVVRDLFGAIQPTVWVSDMLGSQRGHGADWQVCLAHLLRDARYAVECGDIAFSAAFKRLLLRAIAIGRRRDALKDATLKQYHADLDRRLDRIMAAIPIGEPGGTVRIFVCAGRPFTDQACALAKR